ncbi:hypothetical protein BSQ84_14250 [Enterococcus faecium]|nr:hypothetical protein BSQ84_14250 [Enterococcus faecium]
MKKNLENVVSPSSFFNFQVTESYFCYLTFRSILDSFCSKSDIYSGRYYGSIIYGTDESELILQPHFHFRY